jgi:hypothetical protein
MKRIGKNKTIGRYSAAFAICMIMVLASAITAVGVSLKQNSLGSTNFMSYSFDFTQPGLGTIHQNGAGYTSLSMAGCISVGKQAGDPAMPVKVLQLMLPPKKAVYSISVIGTPVSVPLSGADLIAQPIVPEQKPVPIGSDQPTEWTFNPGVYSTNANYPSTLYSNDKVGYSHGYAILSFTLNPVQYNPEQGTLVYYPKLTVVVSLKTDNGANKLYRNSPDDLTYVKTLVSNPDIADQYSLAHLPVATYAGGLCSNRASYDYVIVTTTENGLDHWDIGGTLAYNWDSLIAKHNGEGLTGTEVLVQDIRATPAYWNSTSLFNDTQAKIREFCKDAYANWGTKYILFGGDADANALPPRIMDSYAEGGIEADIYWSNLDNNFNADHDSSWGEEGDSGFDYYWDVAIGRVVCEHPQDVSNWLTKCFFYTDSAEPDYLDNAAFYGGNTGWNCQGDDFMDYSAIKGTNTWLGPNPDQFPSWVPFQFGFETWNANNLNNQYNLSQKWTEAPSPNPGWSGNGVQGLRDAINNDLVTVLSGIAHADNQMSLDVYDSDWQTQYHNTKPFFIHDYGCHCGDFDAGNGVLDTMLFMSDTKLAFGCVYNTGYGWGNFDCTNSSSAFQTKEFWGWFLDVVNNSGDLSNWQFGKAMGFSKDKMAPMIDWSSGSWRETIQCCLLFGDPAMMLKTPHPSDAPLKPSTPVGQTLGIWHVEYSYTSSTTDPNGDQIYYLFDWNDGSTSGWLGPYSSGQTVTAKHTWSVLGNYSVKVKAKDTWGAGSPPSDALLVTITDNTPPLAPQINGPHSGVPGNSYRFDFQTTDPQDQNIWYFVDWGDNTTSGWLGPYVSGFPIHLMHSWSQKGAYNVRAKAKDTMDMEGPWGNMTVTMPLDLIFSATQSQQLLYTTIMGLPYHQDG